MYQNICLRFYDLCDQMTVILRTFSISVIVLIHAATSNSATDPRLTTDAVSPFCSLAHLLPLQLSRIILLAGKRLAFHFNGTCQFSPLVPSFPRIIFFSCAPLKILYFSLKELLLKAQSKPRIFEIIRHFVENWKLGSCNFLLPFVQWYLGD